MNTRIDSHGFKKPVLPVISLLATLLISSAMPAPTHGADNTSESPIYPWSSNGIRQHVMQQNFSGTLSPTQLKELVSAGESLFSASFTSADGAGRPMSTQAIIPTKRKRPPRHTFARTSGLDSNACSSCHNSPVTGGAGDFSVNVFVSEGFQNTDFDNTDPQFSNERNTNHLFGAGLVELLAREMTADLQQQRRDALASARADGITVTARLHSKGVLFGELQVFADGRVDHSSIDGVDSDLTIRPFSQKGVMTSLRQFTINALNHHHGMLATERYGERWTGQADFDEDGIDNEIKHGDVTALVAWQATLRAPTRLKPENQQWQEAAALGGEQFNTIGCASCHKPSLPLDSLVFSDPGQYDTAGTRRPGEDQHDISYNLGQLQWAESLPRDNKGRILVPLFGDLKRHKIADQEVATLGNELLAQRFVERDVFMTAELWGIASTAPYGHRGDLTTLDEVIRAHGGDARASRDAYIALQEYDQQQLIAFLATLTLDAKHGQQEPDDKNAEHPTIDPDTTR